MLKTLKTLNRRKKMDFKTLLKEMYDKVRSTPEGEQAYQKQKKIEEKDKKNFFDKLIKDKNKLTNNGG